MNGKMVNALVNLDLFAQKLKVGLPLTVSTIRSRKVG